MTNRYFGVQVTQSWTGACGAKLTDPAINYKPRSTLRLARYDDHAAITTQSRSHPNDLKIAAFQLSSNSSNLGK